ncbi:NADH-quinone oxidoreductase subunit H [Geodia barretti]|uniref:NADH-ubiquinone oxidoreductase chain 1 n=2 Tax=Geodia barretti TaxID=519541 RepID=A0AA35TG21_GEOBA|nr:NADH-quinone oxidoreductase subunit H [Geodia barretti]
MLACCVIFVAVVPLLPLGLVLAERKVSAHIQDRVGPMRVGPHGILQTLADGVKLIFKEDHIPREGDKFLFVVSPYIIFACSFAVFAAIPFGRSILVSELNIGIFYIMAISSVIVMGVIMAGWASNSKWSLLGAMRSAAQIVSYEIPIGLGILSVVMLAQTLNMQEIVKGQDGIANWLIFRTPFTFIAFFVFFISSIAEVNRTPFDLPEAESELVAGFHTEYSGMRFALFFIAEYANMFAVSAIASTLFLGGWHGAITLGGLLGVVIKTLFLVFVMMWIRWTLPRLRVDQLMNLCWKYFIPISFFNILGVGIWGLIFPKDSRLSIIISIAAIILGLIFTFGVLGKSLSKGPKPPPSSAERRVSATT